MIVSMVGTLGLAGWLSGADKFVTPAIDKHKIEKVGTWAPGQVNLYRVPLFTRHRDCILTVRHSFTFKIKTGQIVTLYVQSPAIRMKPGTYKNLTFEMKYPSFRGFNPVGPVEFRTININKCSWGLTPQTFTSENSIKITTEEINARRARGARQARIIRVAVRYP